MSNISYTADNGHGAWMADLGTQIRLAREKAKMSQQALADRVSKSRVTINSYENGKGNPEFRVVADIAAVLGKPFNVRGCRIGPEDAVKPPPAPEQLRLDFDQDHTFLGRLTIRPSRGSVLITAEARLEDKLAI